MDDVVQRYAGSRRRASLDGFAIAKGWFTTLGVWLGGSLVWAIVADAAESGTTSFGYVDLWSIFAAVSILAAMVPGLPLALLLDRVLRRVQVPWIHVAAFLAVFTLLPAMLWLLTDGAETWSVLALCALLGTSAAIGRAAAFCRGTRFRKPATWL